VVAPLLSRADWPLQSQRALDEDIARRFEALAAQNLDAEEQKTAKRIFSDPEEA
jgi:hypothetical protein